MTCDLACIFHTLFLHDPSAAGTLHRLVQYNRTLTSMLSKLEHSGMNRTWDIGVRNHENENFSYSSLCKMMLKLSPRYLASTGDRLGVETQNLKHSRCPDEAACRKWSWSDEVFRSKSMSKLSESSPIKTQVLQDEKPVLHSSLLSIQGHQDNCSF